LHLNCKFGYRAEQALEPLLELWGFDPVKVHVVDYDKFDAMRAAYRKKQAHNGY
jgi:hypothetical protein